MSTPHRTLLQRFAPHILALPERASYEKAYLWAPDSPFLLYSSSTVSIFYAPFGHINPEARIALVGITPGFSQVERAFRVARRALQDGLAPDDLFREVTGSAAFVGSMRTNLVDMLDELGLPDHLDIPCSRALFAERIDLLHATSAVRYPVVTTGDKNYNGSVPRLSQHHVLRGYLRDYLVYELSRCPKALVVPLGDRVAAALESLAAEGLLESPRLLLGFPHPSGANGHRVKQFSVRRVDLAQRIANWFSRTGRAG